MTASWLRRCERSAPRAERIPHAIERHACRITSQEVMRRHRTRVLYVDDDAELRLCVEGILSRAGYDVTTASAAGEALSCLRDRRYDLVIADQWMPGETGTDLLERARRLGLMGKTRAGVVTSDPDTAAAASGIQMKPMGERALVDFVAHRLRPTRSSRLRRLCAIAAGLALALASLATLHVATRDHAGQRA